MPNTRRRNKNIGIPDYDYGDDVFYPQPKQERKQNENDIAVLFAMCVFAFLVLGTFLAVKFTPGLEFRLSAFFSVIGATDHPGYQLGNVKLGTTMDVLRQQQPDAIKGMTANGSLTLSYQDDEANYTVWYAEDGPYHIAYKARQSRVIEGMSEDDYIGSLAKRYGAPSVSTCSRRITDGMRECRFTWWMSGEVRMDLHSRQELGTDVQRLLVTQIATDTRLEGRIRRANLNTAAE